MRPRALDLFCGAGGVSVGLERAGFDVVGVDINPQPHHRGGAFVQADALTYPLEGFDFIWASPPCQAYTVSRTRVHPSRRKSHPELIEPVRAMLARSGVPYAIENVPGAPLRLPVMLCGAFFGLGALCDDGVYRQLRRHRLIERSWWALTAPLCCCDQREKIGVYGNGGGWANRYAADRRGYKGSVRESREALGIDWMTIAELSQAIPPAYAEWIGRQALEAMGWRRQEEVGPGGGAGPESINQPRGA